jgi:ParB-like chromosome segregation protein Spo0J
MSSIILIDPNDLRLHEDVDPVQVQRVVDQMRSSGRFETPLLVDRRTHVVLDGHHRLWASKELGCTRIPCYCVDYLADDSIQLESWRDDVTLTKEEVIEMGLSDQMFPQKTTRHIYTLPEWEPVALDELFDQPSR